MTYSAAPLPQGPVAVIKTTLYTLPYSASASLRRHVLGVEGLVPVLF